MSKNKHLKIVILLIVLVILFYLCYNKNDYVIDNSYRYGDNTGFIDDFSLNNINSLIVNINIDEEVAVSIANTLLLERFDKEYMKNSFSIIYEKSEDVDQDGELDDYYLIIRRYNDNSRPDVYIAVSKENGVVLKIFGME